MFFSSLPTPFLWAAAAFTIAAAWLLYFVSDKPSARKALWCGAGLVIAGLWASHEGPASVPRLPEDARSFLTNAMLVMASIGGNLIAASVIMDYQARRPKPPSEPAIPAPRPPPNDLSRAAGAAAVATNAGRTTPERTPLPAASPAPPLQLLATASLLLAVGALVYQSRTTQVKKSREAD